MKQEIDRGREILSVNSQVANEMLSAVDYARLLNRPMLSPVWLMYVMMCTAGGAYPIAKFAFLKAGLGIWVPVGALLGWLLAACVILAAHMILSPRQESRGFSKRWILMMMLWVSCYGVTVILSGQVFYEANVWIAIALSAIFAILAIIGSVWEMAALGKNSQSVQPHDTHREES